LQKQLSRKLGDTEYAKWVVVIPPEKIQELGWKEGVELDMDSRDNKLILRPKK
jgi:antitoxin component of MazEF toxin-antitoxin module